MDSCIFLNPGGKLSTKYITNQWDNGWPQGTKISLVLVDVWYTVHMYIDNTGATTCIMPDSSCFTWASCSANGCSPDFFSAFSVANRILSMRKKVMVRTPMMTAHVLEGFSAKHRAWMGIKKCVNDWHVSACMIRIGEISKLKKGLKVNQD